MIIDKQEQELIDAVATARAHGDLSENAEYHAAREALALFRSQRQAEVDAIESAERRKQKREADQNAAVQDMIRQGMSMDQIKVLMPWMFKDKK